MYSIDFKNNLGEFLLDDNRKITEAHLHKVCCIGQKDKTCRYISLSSIGFVCMRNSPARDVIDGWADKELMSAMGDNCEGMGKQNVKK